MHVLHHSSGMLEQIRSFLAVLEEGSLHRAAARLVEYCKLLEEAGLRLHKNSPIRSPGSPMAVIEAVAA